ncbi:hypothetical protein PGTUg99_030524 [Puccinia graminis f. sp. tritici]|uniref:alpha-1,2-Mannosidase n=1 Tax=Puccinia graminis f. sp. tritici TaxID=56615 RepID=A0A5B0RUG5_PUCGR|nr:hypothetical protein PGTUg99_030524 [Puccinia graminis f. sp. tritici]
MTTKSGRNLSSGIGAYNPVRSRFRAFLALILTSGLVLYYYLNSHWPLAHESARRPVDQGVGHSPKGTHGLGSSMVEEDDQARIDQNKTYTPEELMKLPVLHHTFEDPFGPRNGFKALRDSKAPWQATTPTGAVLINHLSRNRFPPPDSIDSSRGSSPPPVPIWPSSTLLLEKEESLKSPIPTHKIAGLNASYVWEGRDRIKEGELPKVQWPGFEKPGWEAPADRTIRLERQGWVRRGFQHVWEGYKARAWAHDELKPVSGSFQNPFGGWGATLVDCLDTLLIMNLTLEYNYARTHVKAIDWAHTIDKDPLISNHPKISFFETVIRYLGGLLSAYDLSGDKLMLQRAEDLAEWLLPAFGTSSGVPETHYQMGFNPLGGKVGNVMTSDIGSLSLEFTRLSQLTSKGVYYDVAHKIIDLLDGDQWVSDSRLGTLFPTVINPDSPKSLGNKYTFGAMVDSYYEYLIKQYQLLRGTDLQYRKMYTSALMSARQHLIRTYDLETSGGKNITVIGDMTWGNFVPSLDHLTCFSGAMIALGAQLLHQKEDLDLALRHADACVWAYESTKTGLGPEEMWISKGNEHTQWQPVLYKGKIFRELKPEPVRGAWIGDPSYFGRPETIESVYYMWRITGDRQWQDRGWRMFTSWMEACVTKFGFANLEDVNSWPPKTTDKQESFVLAETFKYYYLLFSEPDLISLDDYVFNTEAHPFRIEIPGKPAKRYWTKPDESLHKMYDPPELKDDERGYGTFLQQWARVDLDKLSQADRQVYNRVMGIKEN